MVVPNTFGPPRLWARVRDASGTHLYFFNGAWTKKVGGEAGQACEGSADKAAVGVGSGGRCRAPAWRTTCKLSMLVRKRRLTPCCSTP